MASKKNERQSPSEVPPRREPLPWEAHRMLWEVLDRFAAHVRYRRRLGGVPPLTPLRESGNLPDSDRFTS